MLRHERCLPQLEEAEWKILLRRISTMTLTRCGRDDSSMLRRLNLEAQRKARRGHRSISIQRQCGLGDYFLLPLRISRCRPIRISSQTSYRARG